MSKLKKKTKETTSFGLKLCFFISKWKDLFQRNTACYIYQKNYCSTLFLFLLVFCFFFALALLWESFGWFTCITLVIVFFYPLGCNLDLVKRKGAEHTSKYFKMSNLNVCNNWCDVPWSWDVSPNFARSFSISPLFLNYSTMNGISFKILWAKLYQKY